MNVGVFNYGNKLETESKIKLSLAVTEYVLSQTSVECVGKTRTLGNDCVYEV